MISFLRHLASGLSFLTLIPVSSKPAAAENPGLDLGKALYTFPLVGLIVGAISVAFAWLASVSFGPPMHIIFALAASAVVTAGLHLDGLADSGDALLSWRSRERKLEIMKDSRVGVMGVLSLILIFVIKGGALIALGEFWWIGVLLAPAWGRWAALYGIQWFPTAAKDGLAADVGGSRRCAQFWIGSSYLLIGSVAFLIWKDNWFAAILVPIGVWFSIQECARAMTKSLGGLTGDTYGALSEIGEAATLLMLCASIRWQASLPFG
ncbi:MAG: adenosylcobinamide-GDP ribazoletransferase [Verrucomicrobiota bacterium]